MSIDELKAAPIEVVLAEFIEANDGVMASIQADRLLNVLDDLGWKIERK